MGEVDDLVEAVEEVEGGGGEDLEIEGVDDFGLHLEDLFFGVGGIADKNQIRYFWNLICFLIFGCYP